MAIEDWPGFVQGIRLSDDSAFYDAGDKHFHDVAGYGEHNGLQITVGTPTFITRNGQRGMLLDNTVQGRLLPSCPWEGTCLMIAAPETTWAGTVFTYPIIYGVATSLASNGRMNVSHASGNVTHSWNSASSVLIASNIHNSGDKFGIKVSAFAMSQEERRGYMTKDGVTVSQTSAVAAANKGVALSGKNTARGDGQSARFGNINGVLDDISEAATKLHAFGFYWFKDNPLITDAALVAADMAALKTLYGAT